MLSLSPRLAEVVLAVFLASAPMSHPTAAAEAAEAGGMHESQVQAVGGMNVQFAFEGGTAVLLLTDRQSGAPVDVSAFRGNIVIVQGGARKASATLSPFGGRGRLAASKQLPHASGLKAVVTVRPPGGQSLRAAFDLR